MRDMSYMHNRRLIYIANARVPTQRAHGLQIAKMCEEFARASFNVSLIIPRSFNSIKDNIFDYYNLQKTFKVTRLFSIDFSAWMNPLPAFFYWIRTISFTLSTFFFVLLHTTRDDFIYVRYDTATFLALVPFLRTRNITCEAHFLLSGWQQKILLRCENIVVITSQAKKIYDQKILFDEKVLVAPDGVSVGDFDMPFSKNEARDRLKLPKDKKLAIYTGYFFEWKGIDVLVRAAKQFDDTEELVLVGGAGYDTERINNLIVQEGIRNVRIIGHRPYREMVLYQRAADCLVVTSSAKNDQSKFFTSPLKLFEYMAAGRPIVASDTSSIREILNERNAILVPADDSNGMVRGIRRAFSGDGEEKATRAKQEVFKYSWGARVKIILDFILKRAQAPKVLYLFAGERREFIEKVKEGEASDSQLIGFNFLSKFGIRPYYFENKIMNVLRRINFHLAPWPAIFLFFRYDVVFMSSNLAFIFFIKGVLRLKHPKIVFYNTFLTNTLRRNRGRINKFIITVAIKNIDMVICPSTSQRTFLIANGFSEERVQVVLNGIDTRFFQPQEKEIDKEFSYVVSVGKDMGRDYGTLFKAVDGLSVRVIVICAKRNIRKDEVIPANVTVYNGVSQKEMRAYIHGATYVILPTYKEDTHLDASDCSGQYVLLEAMAMGKTVVVSERSTLSDYVTHGKSGIVVSAEDVSALRGVIEQLSHDEKKVKKIGNAARELVTHTYTTEKLAESLSSIFKHVADNDYETV